MTFTARFQFVTYQDGNELPIDIHGPVEATTLTEFVEQVQEGLETLSPMALPVDELTRLWGVMELVQSASSLRYRFINGDRYVDIEGLTDDEAQEIVEADEPDDQGPNAFYNNTHDNEEALGLARLAEYVVGDSSARYIRHNRVVGIFEYTDQLDHGAAVAADL